MPGSGKRIRIENAVRSEGRIKMEHKPTKRRKIIQVGLLLSLIGIGFLLHRFGMEHTVLLDNQTIDIGGTTFEEIPYARLIINDDTENPIAFEAGDRDITKLIGPSHRLLLEVLDEDQETVIKSVDRTVSFSTKPSWLLSLPAILAGNSVIDAPTPQEQQDAADAAEEEAESDAPSDTTEGESAATAP